MTKKIIKYLSVVLFIFFISTNVKAMTLDTYDLKINKGEIKYVDVYENIDANVNTIDFSLIYTTYDIVGEFNPTESFTDNIISGTRHSLKLNNAISGNVKIGTIKITASANPKTLNGIIKINNIPINVTINETYIPDEVTPIDQNQNIEEVIDYNLLESINSDIVAIELKKDVFEYTIEINQDIKELDLKPILKDDSFIVDISSQKISNLKDNKIIIKVSNEEIEKEYIINVKINEEKQDIIMNDDANNSFITMYKRKIVMTIMLLSIIMIAGIIVYKK